MIHIATQFFTILLVLVAAACSGSDNTSLSALPSNGTVLAFGDSLTYGYGLEDKNSYPTILAELIGRSVVNRGVSGEVSEDGLKRLPGVLDEVAPDLVILCHGGNDLLRKKDMQAAKANLAAMITEIRSRGAEVLLIAVPRPALLLSNAAIYAELAESENVPIEDDALSQILQRQSLKKDAIHPNEKGNVAFAEHIKEALEDYGAL